MPDFDFDAVDRTHINSVKWDVAPGELPMWVADMDFATAPAVIDAVKQRMENPTYGYSFIPEEYNQAVSSWWKRRHDHDIDPHNIIFATGVIPAVSSAVRSLTNPAEKVVIQSPVYNIFYNSIINNGRRITDAPLTYTNGEYSMDFEALEKAFSDPLATMMILCNPHNPVGKAWSRNDLARVGELADKYHITVVSDEIHCDIMDPAVTHIPFASADPACRRVAVTCCSPSKAFNLAGLHSAYVMIDEPWIRHRVERGLNTDEVAEPNVVACQSTIAAYSQDGAQWLDALNGYIQGNKDHAAAALSDALPGLHIPRSEATYLMWIDCSAYTDDAEKLQGYVRQETGLYVSSGHVYGEAGRTFLRMNLGTSRSLVEDGVQRLIAALRSL